MPAKRDLSNNVFNKIYHEKNNLPDTFPAPPHSFFSAQTNVDLPVNVLDTQKFAGRNLTAKTFSFFSPEHKQKFTAEDVKLKMEKEPDNPDKLRLNLNGMNILD